MKNPILASVLPVCSKNHNFHSYDSTENQIIITLVNTDKIVITKMRPRGNREVTLLSVFYSHNNLPVNQLMRSFNIKSVNELIKYVSELMK